MKVLLLNTYPSGGGAAVSAQRMLQGLLALGVDAKLLTAEVAPVRHRLSFVAERAEVFHKVKFNPTHLFRYSSAHFGVDILHHPWVKEADVIHLHWVQHGFLSLKGIQQLLTLEGKKIFWTLHDFWPLTGGCHIPYLVGKEAHTEFCQKFQTHCGACPLLHSSQPYDASFHLYRHKALLPLHKVHFLAVSQAVARMAQATPLLQGASIQVLPNFISPQEFYPPAHKPFPQQRAIVMVASQLHDPVKGLDLALTSLQEACQLSFHFQHQAHLHLVGGSKKKLPSFPLPTTHHTHLTPTQLRNLYQQACLTLSTSRYETFGQTLLESIACGTPALAFAVGGTPDIITPHLGNGALIPPYNTHRMAEELVLLTEPTHPRPTPLQIANTVAHLHTEPQMQRLLQLYQNG